MDAREEVEKLMGVWHKELGETAKPAKVRQRYPAINRETPTHWRKTLKAWAIVALAFTLFWIVIGMGAGVVERIWP
jgi:cyanate permease